MGELGYRHAQPFTAVKRSRASLPEVGKVVSYQIGKRRTQVRVNTVQDSHTTPSRTTLGKTEYSIQHSHTRSVVCGHDVFQRLTRREPLDLLAHNSIRAPFPALSAATGMGRDQHIGGRPQRMIPWQRFGIGHVQERSGVAPTSVRSPKRPLRRSTSDVDYNRSIRQRCQESLVDESDCL